MISQKFQGEKLSMLGFGTMRLPTLADGAIDQAQVEEMTRYALEHGVNYFDTAYPYHASQSEISIGKALKGYPRDSFCLATKYPGHQISSSYDPAEVFEDQLRKCGVEYFDFYLLHNVCEMSLGTYLEPKWGIIDYFKEQRRLGRIRHLGFSTHGSLALMEQFLDLYGEDMEFCQIQLNWLDWTLQDAKGKVELLNRRNIPIWVMEPVRGGLLCKLNEENEGKLKALRPEEGIPAWGFRFLQGIPGVAMVLSGMSNMAQMMDNVATFAQSKPLNETEWKTLLEVAETLKDSEPCTGCRYCTEHCPAGLDIPTLIGAYNELKLPGGMNVTMRLEALSEDKQPAACLGCGQCEQMCPQKIRIPRVLESLAEKLAAVPKWKDICKEREEAAKRAKGQ